MITLTDKNNLNHSFQTDSYVLLTIENECIKFHGDVSLKSLSPILMKLVTEYLMKRGTPQ